MPLALPTSIRWQLQLWHGALLTLVTCGLAIAYHRSESSEALAAVDRTTRDAISLSLPTISRPPRGMPGAGGPPEGAGDGLGPRIGGGEGRLRDGVPPTPFTTEETESLPVDSETVRSFLADGGFIIAWTRRGVRYSAGGLPKEFDHHNPDVDAARFERRSTENGARVLYHRTRGGDVLIAGMPLARLEDKETRRAWLLVIGGLGTVGLGFAAGSWIIGRALRPLSAISDTADQFAAGDLTKRISGHDGDSELGRLVRVLNDAFGRLENAFAQQKQFTADASHELRTPLAVLISETQLALARERTAEDYRQSLVICRDTAARMRQLVEELLHLARADAGALALNRRPDDLASRLDGVAAQLRALAGERSLTLATDLQSAPFVGDSGMIDRVLTNLVQNALHHAPSASTVHLETRTEGAFAVARVIDQGPGIPSEALPRLFDRFYRVDASRARDKGGSGLGLAIARTIVLAHAGSIEVESDPGKRTCFTVRLPLAAEGARE